MPQRHREAEVMTRLLLPCFLACALSAGAQAPGPEQSFKRAPVPGSLDQRTGATSADLPLNRRYSELTDAEKAIVRGWYDLGPGDEPPFPARGMRPVVDSIMKVQGRLGYEGELYLAATVDPDGRVNAVKVLRSPDPEMSRIAATALMETEFKPALCAGRPCRMDFPLRQILKRGP
jgi:hypothetical protein